MSGRPRGPDRQDHHPNHPVGELPFTTVVAQQPGRLAGLDTPASGLAVHPRALRSHPEPSTCEPRPPHFLDLIHTYLPERHQMPPRRWT